MSVDPPAPQPLRQGETPPVPASTGLPSSDRATAWEFNPEYQRLVTTWQQVLPMLDALALRLDEAYKQATRTEVWDAPVSKRYVEEMAQWRAGLRLYRQAILTSISREAEEGRTQRWVPVNAGAPHAFS